MDLCHTLHWNSNSESPSCKKISMGKLHGTETLICQHLSALPAGQTVLYWGWKLPLLHTNVVQQEHCQGMPTTSKRFWEAVWQTESHPMQQILDIMTSSRPSSLLLVNKLEQGTPFQPEHSKFCRLARNNTHTHTLLYLLKATSVFSSH